MIKQCAWCGRIKSKEGLWMVSDYLPSASHGICPVCSSLELKRHYLRHPSEDMGISGSEER